MTPPQINDGEGWPFRLLGPIPHKPEDYDEWHEHCLRSLWLNSGAALFHAEGVAHD